MGNQQRSPAALIVGIVLLLYALIIQYTTLLSGVMEFLGQTKHIPDQYVVALWAGIVTMVLGLWNLAIPIGDSKFDKIVRAPIAGVGIVIMVALFVRYYVESLFKIWGKAAEPALTFDFAAMFGLNYIFLGIIVGILWVNIIGIPNWMRPGVKTARLVLKMGVITLGAMYSITELKYMGRLSVVMIGFFVMGTVIMVLWLGQIMGANRSLTGVLSSGLGVCGVSAAVAAAPVVKARGIDMAYTIGMVLLIGVIGLFTFPTIGRLAGMNELQFGAWAGTGILNSAQVAAAALIFDPKTIETLKVAEIFNITRVLFLPFIVILLAVWYAKGEEEEELKTKVSLGKVLIDKFPIFVLGFILMFAFSSTGVFTPSNYELYGKHWYNFKPDAKKQLKPEELAKVQALIDSGKVTIPEVKSALEKLVADKQITNAAQTDHIAKATEVADKDTKKILKGADKKVQKTPPTLTTMREYMIWFFAYGLIGLGMQITWETMKQAGGKAAIIGVIAGSAKAILSFFVCLWLIKGAI
ncbi:MAG: putative sulfate exporter family transporter [Nitrospirae bacterium]|nr:putative sulfate exporter family transporter [Nitrospirota bacterium]